MAFGRQPIGAIAERGQRETERRGEEMRWDREAGHEHSGEGEQRPVTGEPSTRRQLREQDSGRLQSAQT